MVRGGTDESQSSEDEVCLQDLVDEGYSLEAATSYLHSKSKKAALASAKVCEREVTHKEHKVPTLRALCTRVLQNPKTIHEKLVMFRAGHFDRDMEVDVLGDDEDYRVFKDRLVKDLRQAFPAILEMYKGELGLVEDILGPECFRSFMHSVEEAKNAKKMLTAYRSGSIVERREEELSEAEQELASKHNIYPYRLLKGGAKWPEGIDVTAREKYLSDAEFEEVFGMCKEAFRALFKHKREELKRERDLF